MKLRRMLALTLVLMTLMTAALAADDPGLYYIGDDATPENLTGHTRIYNAVDAAPGWRYGFVAYLTDGTRVYSDVCAEDICTSSCWARRKAIRCTFGTTTKRRMRRCRLRFGWNGESERLLFPAFACVICLHILIWNSIRPTKTRCPSLTSR